MTSPRKDLLPSVEQLKALSHPLRLRILRLCLDDEQTNKQLADALKLPPATTIRHVRQLVQAGFLTPLTVRTGRRGALERPYRSTGSSWRMALEQAGWPDLVRRVHEAAHAAYRSELAEAGPDAIRSQLRGTMRLRPDTLEELIRRVEDVLYEYAERDEANGVAVSFLWSLHLRRS